MVKEFLLSTGKKNDKKALIEAGARPYVPPGLIMCPFTFLPRLGDWYFCGVLDLDLPPLFGLMLRGAGLPAGNPAAGPCVCVAYIGLEGLMFAGV